MSIENQIPHSSKSQESISISASQNLQRNPSIWIRITDWVSVATWCPYKWLIHGIYFFFGMDIPILKEVQELVDASRIPSRKGWMQEEVEKYHRFILAVQTLEETEPLSPSMKIVLNEALNVAGSALCYVREKQDERESYEANLENEIHYTDEEIEEMMQPDPDGPSISES